MKDFKIVKIGLLVAFYMLMGLYSVNVQAKSGTCGENLQWVLEGNTLTISGTGEMTDWTSNNSLSSEAAPWRSERSNIKEIVIEDGVTSIGAYAFSKCQSLKKIVIPQSVCKIGDKAFFDTTQKKNVYISDLSMWCKIDFNGATANPLNIGGSLYINNELARVLVIPKDITTLKDNTFHTCESIEDVIIPDNVTHVGKAFYNCGNLKSVTISESVEYIAEDAFIKPSGSWVQEINYSGTSEQWNLIGNIENAPIIEQINYNMKTKTIINNNEISIYPVYVKKGNYILAGCYKDNRIVDLKYNEYNDETVIEFVKDAGCDIIKIFTWETLTDLKPLGTEEWLILSDE